MYHVKVTVLLIATFAQWLYVESICYFPVQFQGEFVMQSMASVGNGIQYSKVNITSVSIPIWGNCHRRVGNNFVLVLNYTETSCIRCLHLKLRSSNVLQVFAANEDIMKRCYTSEESAERNCPSDESLINREAAEILLFKIKDSNGFPIRKEYCPIDGKFSVKYISNNTRKLNECTGTHSTMNSCPSGSTLNFRLRDCNFDNNDLRFECLGSWRAPGDENFLIFTDNRQSNSQKPKYRCALYSHESNSGRIKMALSRDSTCATDLIDSKNGYETFILTPIPENVWPAEASFGTCTFPKWMHGKWEHVKVDGDTMIYKDHSSFKTYTIKCVGVQENHDKYFVFSRTQCDEDRYNCMRILKRDNNILEFQLGSNSSATKDYYHLCADENFKDNTWITQGRLNAIPEPITPLSPSNCPISGEYIGKIPDSNDFELCAKLWSDCNTSDLMYYQVYSCDTNEIYEEREYKCLGHWSESKFLYTYTQRRDVAEGTYECFVGVKISNNEIYIREAGEHCQKHIDPLSHGMQLNKTNLYKCIYTTPKYSVSTSTIRTTESTTLLSSTIKSTTKVWSFDTEGAETKGDNNENSAISYKTKYFFFIFVYSIRFFL